MSTPFNALPPHLHPVAEKVLAHFKSKLGISNFLIEKSVFNDGGAGGLRPTLQKTLRGGSLICIEVRENPVVDGLLDFVERCVAEGKEVELHVAFPQGVEDVGFRAQLKHAKAKGIGLMEVGERKVEVHCKCLSLHLAGLRKIKLDDFPAEIRGNLSAAEQTYLDGNPKKGCLEIHELIEAYTRQIAIAADGKGFWKNQMKPLQWKKKAAWGKVAERLHTNFDYAKAKAPELNEVLFSKIVAVTPDRNDGGHHETDPKIRAKQNRKLRTRFEHGVDLLAEVIDAARPLKIKIM